IDEFYAKAVEVHGECGASVAPDDIANVRQTYLERLAFDPLRQPLARCLNDVQQGLQNAWPAVPMPNGGNSTIRVHEPLGLVGVALACRREFQTGGCGSDFAVDVLKPPRQRRREVWPRRLQVERTPGVHRVWDRVCDAGFICN